MPTLPERQKARTLQFLAELVEAGESVTSESTTTARDEERGLQVIIIVAPYQRVTLLTDDRGRLFIGPAPLAPTPPTLRHVEQDALDAAPKPGERPCSVKALAPRAGYSCNSHFREAVRRLEVLGLIRRVPGGIVRV